MEGIYGFGTIHANGSGLLRFGTLNKGYTSSIYVPTLAHCPPLWRIGNRQIVPYCPKPWGTPSLDSVFNVSKHFFKAPLGPALWAPVRHLWIVLPMWAIIPKTSNTH